MGPLVLLPPISVVRDNAGDEKCFIEPSVNSVRMSIKVPVSDDRERMLCRKFARQLGRRADHYLILRRKPIDGYDISFLITNTHLEEMVKEKVIDFIIQFMEEIDKDIKDFKIAVNTRLRKAVNKYCIQFKSGSRRATPYDAPC